MNTRSQVEAIMLVTEAIFTYVDADDITRSNLDDIYKLIKVNKYLGLVNEDNYWNGDEPCYNVDPLGVDVEEYIFKDETLRCYKYCIQYHGIKRWLLLNFVNTAINDLTDRYMYTADNQLIAELAYILYNIYGYHNSDSSVTYLTQFSRFIRCATESGTSSMLYDNVVEEIQSPSHDYSFDFLYSKLVANINDQIDNTILSFTDYL